MSVASAERRVFAGIGAASAGVLGFLFWLLYFRDAVEASPSWTAALPTVNAALNLTTAVLLVSGVVAIRTGRRALHQKLMLATVAAASTFLVSYIVYHHFHGDTPFLGQGAIRPLYFFILISHIVGSILGVPLVLTTLFYAASGRFERHRAIARWTFPIWLYVSVTGVAVYVFLRLWG